MSAERTFQDAIALHRGGRLEAAEGVYREILTGNPGHAGALHLLGVIRQQHEAHQEALVLIGRAIQLCPGKAIYHNNYGAALVSLDRFAEGAASFERALAIRPNYADARANLGMAQAALGEYAAAEASFHRTLECRAWHRDAVDRLARLLERQGRRAEAIRLLESALGAAPCPQFDTALRKLRLVSEQYLASMHVGILAHQKLGRRVGRLANDGTYYYANDARGNRTARFQSQSGVLDSAAINITVYGWGGHNDLVSIKSYANYDDFRRNIARSEVNFSGNDRPGDTESPISAGPGGNADDLGDYEGANPVFAAAALVAGAESADGRETQSGKPPHSEVRKIAFVSPHCLIDFTNGAATATLDGLDVLAGEGFECQAFCGTRLDAWGEVLVEETLGRERIPYCVRNMRIGQGQSRMIFARRGRIGITMFNSASTRGAWVDRAEVDSFLAGCDIFLRTNRPDVVWTYGGDAVSLAIQARAKRLGIPIVFALHNFNYSDLTPFERVDYAIVPAEFARQYYRNKLGLNCMTLPLVIDPKRVALGVSCQTAVIAADQEAEKYVTFVNPEPRKGVLVFARIAMELAARRPDIRLLVVEGAAKSSDMPKLYGPKLGIDLAGLMGGLANVTLMPNDPDARKFFRRTQILLMPSLVENAGLVASEAMMNGIPVIASNRGGLPETIGEAGILLDIPPWYTLKSTTLPTAEEVEPWIAAIERLWDDPAERERWRLAGLRRAELWSPERLAPVYRDFFSNVTLQPGPPLASHRPPTP